MSVNISVSRTWELERMTSVEYSLVDHRDLLKPLFFVMLVDSALRFM